MRPVLIPAALVIALLPAPALAQTAPASSSERDEVLATIQKFFDTMASRNVEAARRLLMPDGRFFAVVDGKQPPAVRSRSLQEHLDMLASGKQRLLERFWNPEVRIHGPIAAVWTPYDFWIDGKFSHCGVDAFDLVRTADGWTISGGVYTVQREGCPPSPLGPPK